MFRETAVMPWQQFASVAIVWSDSQLLLHADNCA